MKYEDICKFIAIKQAQHKIDREMEIAKDYLKKGKNHKCMPRFKKPKNIVIQLV